MCTSNQEFGCLLIEGRASPAWRAEDGEARRTFLIVCQLLFAKKVGENKKWNLAKPDFTRLGDSESL